MDIQKQQHNEFIEVLKTCTDIETVLVLIWQVGFSDLIVSDGKTDRDCCLFFQETFANDSGSCG
jgi:hypothetical protein